MEFSKTRRGETFEVKERTYPQPRAQPGRDGSHDLARSMFSSMEGFAPKEAGLGPRAQPSRFCLWRAFSAALRRAIAIVVSGSSSVGAFEVFCFGLDAGANSSALSSA